jgi:hypothetical protein
MSGKLRGALARLLQIPTFSPAGFLSWAGLIAAVFLVAKLAGLETYTSILSGTSPDGGPVSYQAIARACLYIVTYAAFVWVTPPLLLGAGIFYGLERLLDARRPPAPFAPPESG